MFLQPKIKDSLTKLLIALSLKYKANQVWSYSDGKQFSVEVASLIGILLLFVKQYKRDLNFNILFNSLNIDELIEVIKSQILKNQNLDGGWTTANKIGQSDWNTGRALLFLRYFAYFNKSKDKQIDESINNAIYFLAAIRNELFKPTVFYRLLLYVIDGEPALRYGRGWPWDVNCYQWIEPTCYNLLAFKLPQRSTSEYFQKIIKQANRYLLEHSCLHGGWNYGNDIILGHEIPAITATTAEALITLQDVKAHPVINLALKYLFSNVNCGSTVTELALTQIVNDIYLVKNDLWLNSLLESQNNDGSFGLNNYVSALAGLSLLTGLGYNAFKMSVVG